MLRGVVGHVRRQPVAFVALFFALGGGAMAANNFIRSSDTIPSGDLAGSTYGSPSIKSGAVTNDKLANSSLTVSPGTGLTGGGSVSLGGSTTLGVADGGIGTTQLAGGSVTTSKFATGAQAPDSAKLAGADPTAYGAVLSGRVNGLSTASDDYGAASGTSTATATEANVSTLSPAHDLVARDLSVKLTAAPGSSFHNRAFFLFVNGSGLDANNTELACQIFDTGTTCTDTSRGMAVPAGSTISISDQPHGIVDASDVRFSFRLTNS
jgi:hypothetical protein